ncbi:DUF2075 domain-containing protein [Marivirga arenosa]|uniref:DUF2075 domain-containing protein n=1 Tax=Marivirga arenosa TaxID=3059076 RepID=A0AA49GCB4_9BACT|nr:DUF2075 domain-containing protein [Marivirga sp. BKB1-2]WKK79412.2 DUF2075 domain-containing protein [Marivirga sp. BKB1-2]
MKLYSGSSSDFINDNNQNLIVSKLQSEFFKHFRQDPQPSEIRSWKESLQAMSSIFEKLKFTSHGVLLEYQLPLTSKRLDCLICGKDDNGKENAVIIELKQWSETFDSDCENSLSVNYGVELKELLHPSVQVGQYAEYLSENHSIFTSNTDIPLFACAYLHNYDYSSTDPLFNNKFSDQISKYPIFCKKEESNLEEFLLSKLSKGDGLPTLEKIQEGKYNPPKKLLSEVSEILKDRSPYILLDEQLVVFDKVKTLIKNAYQTNKKAAVIVKGGPGTGKSVIALNLLSYFLHNKYKSHYATGSKAFTETFRKIFGAKSRNFFTYFNEYRNAYQDDLDVLICDEAHRIRESSNNRFQKNNGKTIPQLYEILKASRVTVLFIDDFQIVRPGEIGSIKYVKEYAESKNVQVFEYELESQFRCNGSDGFINWLNNTLGIKATANVIWKEADHSTYDFRIIDSPQKLEQLIIKKNKEGHSARMVAGFCWQWSDPDPKTGQLKEDVIIGDFKRSWNAKEFSKNKLAPNIPKSSLWAYSKNGIGQVGCVYTAQGFEFDYVGVIFGKDMVYDLDNGTWKGLPENSHDRPVKKDKVNYENYIKNTYKILMSRGIKGCYIHFIDKDTERFFKSRME